MNLEAELELSLYEELKTIHKSSKSEVILVHNNIKNKLYIKRLLKECNKDVYYALKNIKSENIPKIYEVFEIDNKLVVIEEFVNGKTLHEKLKETDHLEEIEVINYIISLCDILNILHNLNPPIIHRDIKPSNIMISNDNVLKLIDFDISRNYKYGENMDTILLGTKGYASPEQFGFEQSDCRSDIYSLGIMMNVLTTGKHIKEVENKGLLENVIKKCTKISPDDRYQDVSALKSDLIKLIYKTQASKEKNINKIGYKLKEKIINEDSSKPINIKTKKINKNTRLKSKYIPGFRNGNRINMTLSTVFYIFLIIGLFVVSSIGELIQNLIVVIMLLMYFLLYTNFLDIKNKLPIIKSNKLHIKILGYVLYSNIIFWSLGIPLTYIVG
ncbi:serine/threonine-protein kinase [Romboutsia hominis]|uniref:Protein kinase domain protein n=1 Tax=Romboutsia hominis TaxID=1507512 RepID=A0A2P2BPZ6_9FIRM|nr:serine/threonine-protein kinase [Romboutsia hominis]MCH1959754.1 serine/threonine protein kinase [Romboutsia hominis]MCH1969823.1 serine/threonine protein kinase [Romboutsia hominis]CEI72415.1 Protein kinase domain protein [Romboutsia hominis]